MAAKGSQEKVGPIQLPKESTFVSGGSVLKLEVQILRRLEGRPHVAQLLAAGKKINYCYMIMTLRGDSLNNIIGTWPPSTTTARPTTPSSPDISKPSWIVADSSGRLRLGEGGCRAVDDDVPREVGADVASAVPTPRSVPDPTVKNKEKKGCAVFDPANPFPAEQFSLDPLGF